MMRIQIYLAAAGLALSGLPAAAEDLAGQIYRVAQTKVVNTSIPDWNGKAVAFSGKIWIAPDKTTAPMVTVPLGGHFIQVKCSRALADPPKDLQQGAPARIRGTIADVSRVDADLKGVTGFAILALSGGTALFSGPAVVVTLDDCGLG